VRALRPGVGPAAVPGEGAPRTLLVRLLRDAGLLAPLPEPLVLGGQAFTLDALRLGEHGAAHVACFQALAAHPAAQRLVVECARPAKVARLLDRLLALLHRGLGAFTPVTLCADDGARQWLEALVLAHRAAPELLASCGPLTAEGAARAAAVPVVFVVGAHRPRVEEPLRRLLAQRAERRTFVLGDLWAARGRGHTAWGAFSQLYAPEGPDGLGCQPPELEPAIEELRHDRLYWRRYRQVTEEPVADAEWVGDLPFGLDGAVAVRCVGSAPRPETRYLVALQRPQRVCFVPAGAAHAADEEDAAARAAAQ
jgi:hypothetical protein